MKSKLNIITSNYFLETFKDFYSLKSKFIFSDKDLNDNNIYLYTKELFESEELKERVYQSFLNGHNIKAIRSKVNYIDLNINNLSDLFLYNFVRLYTKSSDKFREYKLTKKNLNRNFYNSDSMNTYIKTVNKEYSKYKEEYLKYRTAFKIIFKNHPQLGQYYLYLANCNIDETNINITNNNLL